MVNKNIREIVRNILYVKTKHCYLSKLVILQNTFIQYMAPVFHSPNIDAMQVRFSTTDQPRSQGAFSLKLGALSEGNSALGSRLTMIYSSLSVSAKYSKRVQFQNFERPNTVRKLEFLTGSTEN